MGKVKDAEENGVENQVRDRARCYGGGHCYWDELTHQGHIEQAFQEVSEQIMATQDDALSLLNKYAEEKTSVLAVLVTPSLSVARLVGTIRVSIVAGVPYLLAGKEDSKSDQIKFRLSDCMFEYGAFREEPADKFEAFLVVGSIRGDTLSLFEPKG